MKDVEGKIQKALAKGKKLIGQAVKAKIGVLAKLVKLKKQVLKIYRTIKELGKLKLGLAAIVSAASMFGLMGDDEAAFSPKPIKIPETVIFKDAYQEGIKNIRFDLKKKIGTQLGFTKN